MKPPRLVFFRAAAHVFCASSLASLALTGPLLAQTAGGGTAPGSAASSSGAVGSSAPAANSPAPGVSAGVPGAAVPPGPLSLSEVVALALGNNSGLVLARQRLQQAQELVNQVNAQAKPQISAAADYTHTSYRALAPTLPAITVSNPTLPGGGTIPEVIDQAGGLSTAFIGGGGGGNAPSTGAVSSLSSGAATGVGLGTVGAATGTATSGIGTTAASPGVGSTAAPGVGAGPGASGTGGTGAAGGTGTGGAAAGAGGAAGMALLGIPDIVSGYVVDTRTLTQPPGSVLGGPAASKDATPPAATAHDEAAQDDPSAQPRQAGDTNAGGGATSTSSLTVPTAAIGSENAGAARIGVGQLIDLFGLVPTARDAENDVRDFYAIDITRLQNETALAAKNLFFNVLLAQANVATEQEQVRYNQENVRITTDRFQQGIVAQYDVITAQTALATAEQQLTAAQDTLELTESDLSYLLGTDPNQPLPLIPPPLPPLNDQVNLPQSTAIGLRQRPELAEAHENINEAQRLIKLSGSTLLPVLGIVADGQYNTLASTQEPDSFATISAEIAVPIDDGGATRSRVRSAKIDVQTQVITQGQLRQNVSLEVREAAINVHNGQAQIGQAQVAVTQGEAAVKLAYDRYQAGVGTFLDILNSLALLATARTNESNAEFFYQTALAQLVRAMGGR